MKERKRKRRRIKKKQKLGHIPSTKERNTSADAAGEKVKCNITGRTTKC